MANADITLEQEQEQNRKRRSIFSDLLDVFRALINAILSIFGFTARLFGAGGGRGNQAAKEQAVRNQIAENAPDLDGIDNDLKHVSDEVRKISNRAEKMMQVKLAKEYARDLINEQAKGKDMAYPDHRMSPNIINWLESLTLDELAEVRDGNNMKIRDHIDGKKDMGILPFDQRNEKRRDVGEILRKQTEELFDRNSPDSLYSRNKRLTEETNEILQRLQSGTDDDDFRDDFMMDVSASHAPKYRLN